jgi:hypothetical protein
MPYSPFAGLQTQIIVCSQLLRYCWGLIKVGNHFFSQVPAFFGPGFGVGLHPRKRWRIVACFFVLMRMQPAVIIEASEGPHKGAFTYPRVKTQLVAAS